MTEVTDITRLDGEVAIVTGAAQGIGRGIANVLGRGRCQDRNRRPSGRFKHRGRDSRKRRGGRNHGDGHQLPRQRTLSRGSGPE